MRSFRRHAFPAVVLAAGAGRRMGRPKARVPWRDGVSLLDDAILRARSVAGEVHVMTGAGYPLDRYRARCSATRWWRVHDWARGQSRALQSALAHLGPGALGVLVVLVDQPRVPVGHLGELMRCARSDPARPVASEAGGLPMAPAWLPRNLWEELRVLSGDQGAGKILRQGELKTIACPEAGYDVDTPAELIAARAGDQC